MNEKEKVFRSVQEIKLAKGFTIGDYRRLESNLESEQNRRKIAEFIEKRFRERFITPLRSIPKGDRNGFSIVALSCLMIESLGCYRLGWEGTDCKSEPVVKGPRRNDKSRRAFNEILEKGFEGIDYEEFYHKIRCGILHQGETYGGWIIRRRGSLLIDSENRILNANLLLDAVERALVDYTSKLKELNQDDLLWMNLRKKMEYTINHCEKE